MKITKIYHGFKDQCRCGCNGTYHKEGDKDFLYWVGEFNRLAAEKPLTYEGETVKTKIEEVECSDILGTVLCAYREKDHSNSFMNNLTFLKQ